jgi:hypothetical protein
LRWLPLALWLLAGCSSDYELILVLPNADARAAAAGAELTIQPAGTCPAPVTGANPDPTVVLRSLTWDIAGSPPVIGEIDPGEYALYARVRDGACLVRWAGCLPVKLERDGKERLEIPLAEVAGPTTCPNLESCQAGGQCLCSDGRACSGTPTDTCCADGCTDLGGDPRNCSACGVQCPGTECSAAGCHGGVCDAEPTPVPDGTPCSGGGTCTGGVCSAVCTPSTTEDQACGDCGTQTRTCDGQGQWGTFGDCGGEGICTPGDLDSRSCGNCGAQSRTCNDDCTWSDWSECVGEGECVAGTTEQRPCGDCGTQERHCSNACHWTLVGTCDDTPGVPGACDDQEICTTDTCDATGLCQNPTCTDDDLVCCPDGCAACCGTDATSCVGDPGACQRWDCQDETCVAVDVADGTDPGGDCPGRTCCAGACAACCGTDTSTCGAEALCTNWSCVTGVCTPVFETNATDPEDECTGTDCCNGSGACVPGSC